MDFNSQEKDSVTMGMYMYMYQPVSPPIHNQTYGEII